MDQHEFSKRAFDQLKKEGFPVVRVRFGDDQLEDDDIDLPNGYYIQIGYEHGRQGGPYYILNRKFKGKYTAQPAVYTYRDIVRDLKRIFIPRKSNPSVSKRQQKFMCADYGRAKAGKSTRTGMKKAKLREYCKTRVTRKSNPHLTSGKWRFVGFIHQKFVSQARRQLKIHGVANKVTKDHAKHDPKFRELYASRDKYEIAYRLLMAMFHSRTAA